jgi:hypothetical protein
MGTTKDIRAAVQAELSFDPLVGQASRFCNSPKSHHNVTPTGWVALTRVTRGADVVPGISA